MPINERLLILVVEDEALVRMHGCDMLESAGFEVLEAETADEAVRVLERHAGIHLLFSDIDMPGSMDGLELAALVHRRWAQVRLLMTSGHHQLGPDALPNDGRFVAKPWKEDAVLGEVRAMLSARLP